MLFTNMVLGPFKTIKTAFILTKATIFAISCYTTRVRKKKATNKTGKTTGNLLSIFRN